MFIPILNQMIFLFAFIIIGFVLRKCKLIPENSATVLSKLENMIFVPALVMGTFIQHCNTDTVRTYWKPLVIGFGLIIVLIPLSILVARLCFKEDFLRKISTYGLAFSNFGFMGNAIMQAAFPDIFTQYVVFTLPFWFMIYLWGAPVLLISDGKKKGLASRLKAFLNPMLIAMLIGLIIGLVGLKLPAAVLKIITVSGDCMSPVAMLLTGITIAQISLLTLLKKWRLYIVTAIKLLVYPLLFILVFAFVPANSFLDETMLKCAMCVMCMPMGLNAIVIPAAYGKDTSDAAGLALFSHTLSVITIPLMFMLFQNVVL